MKRVRKEQTHKSKKNTNCSGGFETLVQILTVNITLQTLPNNQFKDLSTTETQRRCIRFQWNAVCPNWLNFALGQDIWQEKALTRKITQSNTYVGWSAEVIVSIMAKLEMAKIIDL